MSVAFLYLILNNQFTMDDDVPEVSNVKSGCYPVVEDKPTFGRRLQQDRIRKSAYQPVYQVHHRYSVSDSLIESVPQNLYFYI